MNIQDFLKIIVQKKDLTQKEAKQLVLLLTQDGIDPLLISAILIGLATKGESFAEIAGFIQGMRAQMQEVIGGENAMDIVGTGGDGKATVNISTAASFVVAGAGIQVAKHGNRAASSQCGSADVLEALGINIQLDSKQAANVLKKVGMVFLFAPLFHPAMKQVVPVRKTIKIKTIFNLLGPFLNPAGVKRQLLGVADLPTAKTLVEVAKKLNYKKLLIVTSLDGLDEVSLFAKTHAFEISGETVKEYLIDPAEYGFKKATLADIVGADAPTNATMIKNVLAGKKGPVRDIVLLNSACALVVAGKVTTIAEGITMAKKSIDSGAAKNILERLRKETQYA